MKDKNNYLQRERKKESKKDNKGKIYNAKHIRIKENERTNKINLNPSKNK
jgi:hypothetical protein